MDNSEKTTVLIDVGNIQSSNELQLVLKRALDFPSFYGMNWDAFWDTITGLIEMPDELMFINWSYFKERFPEDSSMLSKLLEKFNGEHPSWKCDVVYKG